MKKQIAQMLIVLSVSVIASGCSDNAGAKRLLENQGYTNVKTDGHSWFGCAKDDEVATSFTATNSAGKQVSGSVCRGFWAKSSTIRFDD